MAGIEIKWSCGCYEQDGKLVQECTQTAPVGEISAGGVKQPFSRKCFRKGALPTAADESTKDATA